MPDRNDGTNGYGGGVIDVIYEMRDRLIRVEEGFKQVGDIKADVSNIESDMKDMNRRIEDVGKIANSAEQRSVSNEKRADQLNVSLRWGIGIFVAFGSLIIALLGFIIKYLI